MGEVKLTRGVLKQNEGILLMMSEIKWDVKIEVPSAAFSEEIGEGRDPPEPLKINGHSIQPFFVDSTDIPQVIWNNINWNCRSCFLPPSQERSMFYADMCTVYLEKTHPHLFCGRCMRSQNNQCSYSYCKAFKCKLCKAKEMLHVFKGGLKEDFKLECAHFNWNSVTLPSELVRHISLLQAVEDWEALGLKLKVKQTSEVCLKTDHEWSRLTERALLKADYFEAKSALKRAENRKINLDNAKLRKEEQKKDDERIQDTLDRWREEQIAMILHKMAIDGGEGSVCGICFMVFKNSYRKYKHQRQECFPKNGIKVYTTKYKRVLHCWKETCTATASDFFKLERHMKSRNCPTKSFEERDNEKMCGFCGKLFCKKGNKLRHEVMCKAQMPVDLGGVNVRGKDVCINSAVLSSLE